MKKNKVREPRKRLNYVRVMMALIEASNATYSQHEASTSDSYLKRRISNATGQMMARVLLKLFPRVSARRGTTLHEWQVTLEDVDKFRAQVGLLEARMP